MINDKFHRINDLRSVANIYSNEYSVILTTVDPSNQRTALTLASSIGVPKLSYYDGMAISFITAQDTKGITQVSIDNIAGLKTIYEPDYDIEEGVFNSLPLYANQIVRAIFKKDIGGFVKDKFETLNPKIDPAPKTKNPTKEEAEQGIMPEVVIPTQNQYEYVIESESKGANSFTEFDQCINAILNTFPERKRSGLNVTVTIKKELFSQKVFYTSNTDLSWITLCAENDVITFETDQELFYFFTIEANGSFFSIKKGTDIIVNTPIKNTCCFIGITRYNGSEIRFEGITFKTNTLYSFANVVGRKLSLKNVTISGFSVPLSIQPEATVDIEDCKIKNWKNNALHVNAKDIRLLIKTSDLQKDSASSIDDIRIQQNNLNSKTNIIQIDSKAKCSYNGLEMSPNTIMYRTEYNVHGGQ